MSDAEVALELLKLLLAKGTVAPDVKTKDDVLRLYRECLTAVQGKAQ